MSHTVMVHNVPARCGTKDVPASDAAKRAELLHALRALTDDDVAAVVDEGIVEMQRRLAARNAAGGDFAWARRGILTARDSVFDAG